MTPLASRITQRVREVSERVASSEGMEIVDVEYKGGSRRGVVRIFIDKPAGISHADCELVSRQVSTILDVEDVVPGSYVLEVSSPGLDRKLVKPADYERFAGRKARLKLRRPVEGRRQFTGRVRGHEQGEVELELEKETVVRIPFEDVESARLVVEL